MIENDVVFEDDEVTVGDQKWTAPAPVVDAVRVGDIVVVILDRDLLSDRRAGQVQNLRAYTVEGDELWTAEHPTNTSADCYTKIINREPLRVANFAGYTCELNAQTGRLLETVFTK
jgi:hypothetical protein